MKFLAMSRRVPGVTDDQVLEHAEVEALAVFRQMRVGRFEQIHFSRDWKGAVLHVIADSRDEARALLDALPMVRHGVITFDLWQLDPFDHYARLFRDEFREAT